jgi:hypothetical protein
VSNNYRADYLILAKELKVRTDASGSNARRQALLSYMGNSNPRDLCTWLVSRTNAQKEAVSESRRYINSLQEAQVNLPYIKNSILTQTDASAWLITVNSASRRHRESFERLPTRIPIKSIVIRTSGAGYEPSKDGKF